MLLKRWSVVRSGLQLREWIFGAGVPFSSTRFLYDNVGQVFLISWNAQKGPQVTSSLSYSINWMKSFDLGQLLRWWSVVQGMRARFIL